MRDQARILRLVVTRIVGKAAMETETILRIELRCKDGDKARVDASRDVGADRDVRPQVNFEAVVEKFDQMLREIARAMIEINLVANIPIAANLDTTVFDNQIVTGL